MANTRAYFAQFDAYNGTSRSPEIVATSEPIEDKSTQSQTDEQLPRSQPHREPFEIAGPYGTTEWVYPPQ
jgi:hypothetical protein